MCDSYYCDNLTQTTFRLYLIDFQLNADFPSQRYSKIGFQENAFQKSKTRRLFFVKLQAQIIILLLLKTISGF